MLDLRLAEGLEFERPRAIRQLIERNLSELERYGTCHTAWQVIRGNETTEYWLTEPQALLIAMRSDAPRAADCRAEIVAVFMAYRHGGLVPAAKLLAQILSKQDEQGKILTEVKKNTERTDSNVIQMRAKLDQTYDRVNDALPRRRDFTAETGRIWDWVVVTVYGGFDPSGSRIRIIDESGNRIEGVYSHDHWWSRKRNGLKDGWPVALPINQKMEDPEIRRTYEARFCVFQEEVSRAEPPKLPKNSDPNQFKLL